MIAIIAGTGALPIQACKTLTASNKPFFVISLFPEDNLLELQKVSNNIVQQPFYKTRAIFDLLKKQNTQKVLFIGKVDKQNLLKKFKLDWFAIKILATLATKSDFSIMNRIEAELNKIDITLLSQNEVLKNLFVKPGVLTGTVTPEIQQSIDFGLETATRMSSLDIGQTVVVKDKMILAVEAIEGTDACIQRGIALGNKQVVVCKTANPDHNKKFDLPTIGTATLANVKPGDVVAIAWHANKTFIADKEQFIARAQELNIALIAM